MRIRPPRWREAWYWAASRQRVSLAEPQHRFERFNLAYLLNCA